MKSFLFASRFTVLFVISVLVFSGCAAIRKVTYPPNFTYLEKKTVTSSMHQLAVSIEKLDSVLREMGDDVSAPERERVISQLNNMESIANNLGAGTQVTNHLLLDQHIDQFKSDVISARRSVESEPPNFYLVGRLSGSCTGCHVLR